MCFVFCRSVNGAQLLGVWRKRKAYVGTSRVQPYSVIERNELCGRPPQYAPVTLTFDLESGVRVTCDVGYICGAVPILVFLGLSVLDLGPMYATDRQTSDSIIA